MDVINIINDHPDTVQWINPQTVNLEKLETGKLGVVLLPRDLPGKDETLIVVSQISSECRCQPADGLMIGARVTHVDGHDVTKLKFEDFAEILEKVIERKNIVPLTVCSPKPMQALVRSAGRTTNMAAIPVESPALLNNGDVDIASETLTKPGYIQWDSNVHEVVIEKQKKKEKIGLKFRIKEAPDRKGDKELYFLVQSTDPDSLSESKLHKGDWIRSINQKPLAMCSQSSRQACGSSSRDEACFLCSQIPPEMEDKCHNKMRALFQCCSRTKSKPTSKFSKISQLFRVEVERNCKIVLQVQSPKCVQPSRLMTSNPYTLDLPPRRSNRCPDKIDGRSLYSIQFDTMSIGGSSIHIRSTRPQLRIPMGRRTSPNRTLLPPRDLDMTNTSSSRTRMALGGHLEEEDHEIPTTSAEVHTNQPHMVSEGISDAELDDVKSECQYCLGILAGEDIKQVPYVNINIITTSDSSEDLEGLLHRIKTGLGLRAMADDIVTCEVSKDDVKEVASHLSDYSVEDLIVAKELIKNLKGSSGHEFLETAKQAFTRQGFNVENLPNQLLTAFLDGPLPLGKDFLQIQFKAFTFTDMLNFWPSVYFTESSVYVIAFDTEAISTELLVETEEEIHRIQTCINIIQTSSSSPKIYLVANKGESTQVEDLISKFENLDTLLNNCQTFCRECTWPCTCDTKGLYGNSFSQIQKNNVTEHIAFCMSRDSESSAFIQALKGHVCRNFRKEHCFPLLAVMVMRLISGLDLQGSTTITISHLKENHIKTKLPFEICDESFAKVLSALHHSGKLCCFNQVAHRTVMSSAHNQYILLNPGVIQECALLIRTNIPKMANPVKKSDIMNNLLKDLAYNSKEEIFLFLQLFHIFVDFVESEHGGSFLYHGHYLQNWSETGTSRNLRRHNDHCGDGSSSLAHGSHRRPGEHLWLLYVDFHGLLPLTMCLWLLKQIGQGMGQNTDITSMCTGQFVYDEVFYSVQLLPYQGRAVISVRSQRLLHFESLHSVMKAVLSEAVQTNLLTYHIGEACLRCEGEALKKVRGAFRNLADKPMWLAKVAHIRDYGAVMLDQSWQCWNIEDLLYNLPPMIDNLLVQGLKMTDEFTQTKCWETLYRRLGLREDSLLRQTRCASDPGHLFYHHLKTSGQVTLGLLLDNLKGTQAYSFVLEGLQQVIFTHSASSV